MRDKYTNNFRIIVINHNKFYKNLQKSKFFIGFELWAE